MFDTESTGVAVKADYWQVVIDDNPNLKEEIEYWRDFNIAYPEAIKEMHSLSSFSEQSIAISQSASPISADQQ